MFKDEYNAMFVEDHTTEKNQLCPPELARIKILEVNGVACKVFYNYVAPYCYGEMPVNHWWGFATHGNYFWKCPLTEGVKTLEDAIAIIQPLFEKVVAKWKNKMS